jgi:dihydroxy-acid dehydratase
VRSDRIKSGPERAPHRSLLKALGLTDADMGKPFIGICNSYTDIIPGHAHLDKVGELIKRAVRQAGGVPFVFNTIGICDGIAMGHAGMKYSLPSRDLIADCVETMVNAHLFDAVICVPNCDKIIPGMYMGALRANVPTVFVSGGPMEAGRLPGGKAADLIDVFYAVAQHAQGKLSDKGIKEFENNACPGCGSCSGMFTANSMNCLGEALGMALPGNGTVLATAAVRRRLYHQAAQRAVAMAKEWVAAGSKADYPLLPRNLCTAAAFAKAMILDMAMGGSTNTVLHLLAMVQETEVRFTLDDIDAISARVPNICRVAPSSTPEGRIYHMEDVHRAGGIHAILGQLAKDSPGLLDESAMTVTGKTLGENIRSYSIRAARPSKAGAELVAGGWKATGKSVAQVCADLEKDDAVVVTDTADDRGDGFDPFDVIRPCAKAFTQRGGLVVLRGNIAKNGSVIKLAGVDPKMYRHRGPAVIFESQEDACAGVLAGKVKAGDVVVIRNEGPRGGPGMQEMLAPTSYIKGAGLGDKCALITDGRFSGGTAGACIGHISPEAAAGGEIGLLKNGDIIEIDILNQTLNAAITATEFARRRKGWTVPAPRFKTGWLARYTALATSADTGGVLAMPAARQAKAKRKPLRKSH